MSPSKPEFVLVPGGWHDPESFNPITTILTKAGYTCHGVHLPTVGASPPFKSSEPDVQAVKNTVERVLSTGKDVILIMHSYGGTVGCEALGPYLDELKFGKEGSGRVVRLIFCSAFVLPEGGSLMKALQMKPLPWFIINGDEVMAGTPRDIFYNDLSDEEAAPYVAALKPMAYGAFFSLVSVAAWKVIPSTYIVCTADKAIPLKTQEGMLAMAEEMVPGSFDVVEKCDAGHSPFLSQPDWLAGKLIKAAKGV